MDIVLIPVTPKKKSTPKIKPSVPKPQKTLLLSEKVAVIREVEKGVKKKTEIANEYGISANTLYTFLKRKNNILNSYAKFGTNQARKRSRGADNPDIEECVLKWFKQSRDNRIQVTGPMICEKAKQFAMKLGKVGFKASTGWLDHFKTRNNISLKLLNKISNTETILNNDQSVTDWHKNLSDIITNKSSKDIFTIKEIGLFYKCTPETYLDFRGDSCENAEFSDQRITILMGANMDGSEKLPLTVIGKYANPRCLQHVKSMPIEYRFNKHVWITKDIFGSFCLKMDEKFRKENRKIVFFIENCTAHTSIPKLENIQIIFFPLVLKSLCQPMCQGIVQNFKQNYRKLVVEKIMLGDLVSEHNEVKINILQSAHMCYSAWDQVTTEIIADCFEKVGFKSGFQEIKKINKDKRSNNDNYNALFRHFISMDENIITCGELAETTIPDKAANFEVKEEIEDIVKPIPTPIQVMEYIEKIRRFAEAQSNVKYNTFRALNQLEKFTITHKLA